MNTSPETATATPNPLTPSYVLKLRSSCDGCGTAKVKCDRARPACGRCAGLALGCIYGPSRKSGKPPRKRPAPSAYPEPTTSKRICMQPPAEGGDGGPHPDAGSGMTASVRSDHPDPSIDGMNLPFPCGLTAGLDVSGQDALRSGFYTSLLLDEWPPFDTQGADLEGPSPSAAPPVNAPGAGVTTHNCPRESYEIFRDLICPTPTLHAPESNSLRVPAQLDDVLRANRSAVDRLGRLLKCPCARSGHRAMVHASIVSRILIWYQQAAGWTGRGSAGTPDPPARPCRDRSRSSPASSPSLSPGAADDSPEGQPSLPQATGFVVEHTHVSFGSFSVEDEELEAIFRNQLILSELRKTARVIDMFMDQDSGGKSANGMAGLYKHLGAWLRSEHSSTVEIVRSGLDALNDDALS